MENFNWEELREQLPTQWTPESKAARMKLWKSMDVNGNRIMSLAEIDKGIRDNIKIDELFDAKPVIMRAFSAAKVKGKGKNIGETKCNDDYVEWCEFRYLLVYLRQYAEYFVMFNRVNEGTDKKIDIEEFKTAVPMMEEWGVAIGDPEATFAEIDTNGGGSIMFQEFSDWAIAKQLDLQDDDDDGDLE